MAHYLTLKCEHGPETLTLTKDLGGEFVFKYVGAEDDEIVYVYVTEADLDALRVQIGKLLGYVSS